MKRLICVCMLMVSLWGCAGVQSEQALAMQLRDKLYKCESCSFTAVITADYTEEIYTFTMDCTVDAVGDMTFTVRQPESLQGIGGRIRDTGGELIFEDTFLAFPTIADGLLTPITTPWIVLRGLRSGYFSAFGKETEGILVQIDDSYQGQPLQIDILLSDAAIPQKAQVIWKGRRILSVEIESFTIV